MLKELRIRDFVLISALDLAFRPGICLLTGETGAGKSILIDALQAALGGRVSLDSIRQGQSKALVEATFSLEPLPEPLARLLEEQGIDPAVAGELTLARELSSKGARCRIEGQQVTQAILRQVGQALVDILSQHEHQALMEPGFHTEILDTFGGHQALQAGVADAHASFAALNTERTRLLAGAQARAQERDFKIFQLDEIEAAALEDPDEPEALQAERLRLANAEQLLKCSGEAVERLYAGEGAPSLYDQLSALTQPLKNLGQLDNTLQESIDDLLTAQGLLREAAARLREYNESLEADPARLETIEDRLDLLKKLDRKYGPGLKAVMAHALALQAELAEAAGTEGRLEALEAALGEAETQLRAVARRLSEERAKAAIRLESALKSQLVELELPNTRFEVTFKRHENPRANGAESAEFYISLNPGEPPRPLARVASGGELARLMLALKTVLAGLVAVPTLVFDEVDTGISGKAARAVAEKLAKLAQHHQVLVITHLPTVAAMADSHVHLEKTVLDGHTHITAQVLDAGQRIHELARLSSGQLTSAALSHAEELIKRAEAVKAGLAAPLTSGRK